MLISGCIEKALNRVACVDNKPHGVLISTPHKAGAGLAEKWSFGEIHCVSDCFMVP
jgi:hypothetical protein